MDNDSRDREDPLGPARGIIMGICFSVMLMAVVAFAVVGGVEVWNWWKDRG